MTRCDLSQCLAAGYVISLIASLAVARSSVDGWGMGHVGGVSGDHSETFFAGDSGSTYKFAVSQSRYMSVSIYIYSRLCKCVHILSEYFMHIQMFNCDYSWPSLKSLLEEGEGHKLAMSRNYNVCQRLNLEIY